MKRIRIGKDFSMRWEITTDGVAIPLDGRDLTVEIKSPAGIKNNIPYRIDGNILIMTYYGYEQKRTGEYSITLWEKKGKPGQNVVDVIRAFELVRTSQEENDFVGGDLQIESVDLGTENFDILTEGGYRAINIDTLHAEALEDSVNINGKTYSNESFTITLPKANLDSAGVMSASDVRTLKEHADSIAQIKTSCEENASDIERVSNVVDTHESRLGGIDAEISSLNTEVSDLQSKVDDVPTIGSDNLVKSGGVYEKVSTLGQKVNKISEKSIFVNENMVFGKYLITNGYAEETDVNRAYCKDFFEIDANNGIKFNWSNYSATIYFYDSSKNFISYYVWFKSFEFTLVPQNAKYFRFSIGSTEAIVANNYTPISYLCYQRKQFIDIISIATLLENCTLDYDNAVIKTNNQQFNIYVFPNFGYKEIFVRSAYYSDNEAVISFYSSEVITQDSKIGVVRGIGRGDLTLVDYLGVVPDNCKMIAVCVRKGSNLAFEIRAKLQNDIVSDQITSLLTNDDKYLLRYGYIDNKGTENYLLDGQSIFNLRYNKINPFSILYIDNLDSYKIAIYFYDKNYSFIKAIWFTNSSFVNATANTYYYRIGYRQTGITNFTNTVRLSVVNVLNGSNARIDKTTLKNGYIQLDGKTIASDIGRVYFPGYISVKVGQDINIISSEITACKVDVYDENLTFLKNLGWFPTDKSFRIPYGVSFIRISFGKDIQVETLTKDILITNDLTTRTSIIESQSKYPFIHRFEISHLFINTINGVNVTIPCQSLFDIEIAARLGFQYIELNCHNTQDGNFVTIHGESGKFGLQVVHIDGDTDISNISISSVTLDYIKENVRYKSLYAKYRTSIPTLDEACAYAKSVGISVELGLNNTSAEYNLEAINICRKYFGENFVVGVYGDNKAIWVRRYFKGVISNYSPTNTEDGLTDICQKVGTPYIHCFSNVAIVEGQTTDADLKMMAETLHKNRCYAEFVDAYTSRAFSNKLFECGFDIGGGPAFSINIPTPGNICELSGDLSFDDFETNGTLENNNIVLNIGNTLTPSEQFVSHFLSGGFLQIRFSGKLKFNMGANITNIEIKSDGDFPVVLSTYFMNEAPIFSVSGVTETTIYNIHYRASRF